MEQATPKSKDNVEIRRITCRLQEDRNDVDVDISQLSQLVP